MGSETSSEASARRKLGIYKRAPLDRKAKCHPDRKHASLGLCGPCYKTQDWKKRRAKPNYLEDNLARHLGMYNMTVAEYQEKLVAQDGKCEICGTDTPVGKNRTRFDVDHNHETGKNRGLLCLDCNRLLSAARDKVEVLASAIRYLIKYAEENS